MKKLATVVLIIMVLIMAFYSTVRLAANSTNEANWFNSSWRGAFSRIPLLRTIFLLHWDGDARANYLLSDPHTSLRIEIDAYDQCVFSDNILATVIEEIEKVTGKYDAVTVTESDTIPLTNTRYTSKEIRGIKERYQTFKTEGSEAVLYVLCINEYDEAPTNIGHTVQEDGVVVFWEKISRLVKTNHALLEDYVASTILHEFGHQIGMKHVESPWCIMDEAIEAPPADVRLNYIPTSYCDEELEAVQKVRESLYNE
ncbi:MAG: hypothetical protein WC505_07825 [Patescibacteria group bacterium]